MMNIKLFGNGIKICEGKSRVMSIPINVRLYKGGVRQDYPQRFMTLSIGRGFSYDVPTFNARLIVSDVLSALYEGEHRYNKNIPEYDKIEIDYYGMTISWFKNNSLIKIKGDVPIGVTISL